MLGLNPSYTGIWLRGFSIVTVRLAVDQVLTLLILEFGFGDGKFTTKVGATPVS